MKDMLDWGSEWLAAQTKLHAQQDVTVTTDGVAVNTKAAITDTEGRNLPGKVDQKVEHTMFLFNVTEIVKYSIKFKRNTIITWNEKDYQVVVNKKGLWAYNDSHKRQIVVYTNEVPPTE